MWAIRPIRAVGQGAARWPHCGADQGRRGARVFESAIGALGGSARRSSRPSAAARCAARNEARTRCGASPGNWPTSPSRIGAPRCYATPDARCARRRGHVEAGCAGHHDSTAAVGRTEKWWRRPAADWRSDARVERWSACTMSMLARSARDAGQARRVRLQSADRRQRRWGRARPQRRDRKSARRAAIGPGDRTDHAPYRTRTTSAVTADRGYGDAISRRRPTSTSVCAAWRSHARANPARRAGARTSTSLPRQGQMANRMRRPNQPPQTQLRMEPHRTRRHRRSSNLVRTRRLGPQPRQDQRPGRMKGHDHHGPPSRLRNQLSRTSADRAVFQVEVASTAGA